MHAKVKLSLLVVLVALSAFVVEAASDSTSDKDQGNVCELPKVVGWCRAALPRWYFDISTGKCTQFKYGGCDGNQNNFMNEETCLKQCGSSPVQGDTPADEDQGKACDLPKVVGRCRAAYPRWYFDTTTGKCTQFIYGGCDGNDNNFMNEEACLKRCDIQPLEVMRKE